MLGILRQLIRSNYSFQVPDKPLFLSGYTDASYLGSSKEGAWGAYFRDHGTRFMAAGKCPHPCKSSNQAELVGILNGIRLSLEHLDTSSGHILVVKTDSQNSARKFGWKGIPSNMRSPYLPEIIQSFRDCHAAGLKLVVTWRKGHQGHQTTEGHLNERVDELAGNVNRGLREPFVWVRPIQ